MKTFLSAFLIIATLNSSASPNYVRKEWKYPYDKDKDCQNTRAEILIERSSKPVTFRSNRKGKSCTVLTGEWQDYYYPKTITEANLTQIDHLVPLKNAHVSGGASWSREMKKKFANDPENLVITSIATNQQKGSKTLETWLPIRHDYACKYYKQWMYVKQKYQLTVTDRERNAVDVKHCP